MQGETMARIVALVDDLFFQARMLETAKQLGIELKTYGDGSALVSEVRKDNPRLIIIDLNARQNPIDAIEQLQGEGIHAPIVGFLSHVQKELAERAKAAGCTEVMPRSLFTQKLATILAGANS
jgi:CheY-like chemotaxis protein